MTQHDTQHDTTRHIMGAYTLGHHLWVAGEQYVRDVEVALSEGMYWVAETLLIQAEQAYAWSNALQAGEVSEHLEDMVSVSVPREDEWVRTEALAMLWERVRGGNLPQHRNHVDAPAHSPQPSLRNVSRETLETPPPPQPAPEGYIGDMETYTATTAQPTLTELVTSLIEMVSKQVLASVREEMESIAEDACENWADGHDFVSEVTDNYEFRSAICDVINDLSISISVD